MKNNEKFCPECGTKLEYRKNEKKLDKRIKKHIVI